MRFWDASALVPLFVENTTSDAMRGLYDSDSQVVAWTCTEVEVRSAVCRFVRDGSLVTSAADAAMAEFMKCWSRAVLVYDVESTKTRAKRLLGVHPLRAADALQLGAAMLSAYDLPLGHDFVSLDARLAEAARREGFRVLP